MHEAFNARGHANPAPKWDSPFVPPKKDNGNLGFANRKNEN